MNLLKSLTLRYSKKSVDSLVAFIGSDPNRFSELIEIFLTGSPRTVQQASWPLSYCVENHPTLILPHLKKILKAAALPHAHDAVKRNVVRLLQFISIPKSQQGAVATLCFDFLENKKEAVAIRVFSMTVLTNLAVKNPALKEEIIAVVEDGMPYAKPAYLSRAKKVLKQLRQLPKS